MNDTEVRLQEILLSIFRAHMDKMENARHGLLLFVPAAIGCPLLLFYVSDDQRFSLACCFVLLVAACIWFWNVRRIHWAEARSIYIALKEVGQQIDQGGIYGPKYVIRRKSEINNGTGEALETMFR